MGELVFLSDDSSVANNLEGDPHLGQRVFSDENAEFRAQIHERPIAISLRDLASRQKFSIAEKLYARYDLWLVPHRFSAFRISGSSTVSSLGCEVEYLAEGQTVSIISLFPTAEFVEKIGADLDVAAKFSAKIDQAGLLEIASAALGGDISFGLPNMKGASMSTSASGGFKIHISLKLFTPFVSAVGTGATRCMFQFNAHREPLYNRDIETWAVIALPKYAESIRYKMRCSFVSRKIFVPRFWRTAWQEIEVSKGS